MFDQWLAKARKNPSPAHLKETVQTPASYHPMVAHCTIDRLCIVKAGNGATQPTCRGSE